MSTKRHILAAFNAARDTSPLVQCLTNTVVQDITANALLATGASPAMCDNPKEAAEFAAMASAVLINLGTPTPDTVDAMLAAAESASAHSVPWVLDPVAVGALGWRTEIARELLAFHPTVIRGNASEISALAGGEGGRGTDATVMVTQVRDQAGELADSTGSIVAVSGKMDLIVDRTATTRIWSGDPMLQLVTGTGCSLGAICAAYLGATASTTVTPHEAVVAAHAHVGAAAVQAKKKSAGPGTFRQQWIDMLHNLTPEGMWALVEIDVHERSARTGGDH